MAAPRILSKLPDEQASALVERLLSLPDDATVLLDRKGQTIFRFSHDGRDLVAKCYQLRGLQPRLIAFLGASRAARSYKAALRLTSKNLPTPEPLLVALAGSPLPSFAYLVTAFQDAVQLSELLLKQQSNEERIIEQLVDLISKLHENRMSHGDFHARNVLVDREGQISLIDLDGARLHFLNFRYRKRFRRDRRRMLESLRKSPDFVKKLDAALPPAT